VTSGQDERSRRAVTISGQDRRSGCRDDHVFTPTQVPGLDHIADVAAGNFSVLALRADGTVWAWGTGNHGELGNYPYTGGNSPYPRAVYGISGVHGLSTTNYGAGVIVPN
jgi:Regulator of chromosome condensation (RCC1) repeat